MSIAIRKGDVLTVKTEGRQEYGHYLHIGDKVTVLDIRSGRPRLYVVEHKPTGLTQALHKGDFYPKQ